MLLQKQAVAFGNGQRAAAPQRGALQVCPALNAAAAARAGAPTAPPGGDWSRLSVLPTRPAANWGQMRASQGHGVISERLVCLAGEPERWKQEDSKDR